MAFAYIITKDIAAKNVDAWNRSVISTVDVPAGAALTLTAGADVEAPFVGAAATTGQIWMAYPSSEALLVVNGKQFAGLSADPRDYVNIAKRPYDAFRVEAGDLVGFTIDAFNDGTLPTAVGQGIKPNGLGWTQATGADDTIFNVVEITTIPFPKADGIGMEQVQFIIGEAVATKLA